MVEALLVLNCGSSSLRFALLERTAGAVFERRHRGEISGIGHTPHFIVQTPDGVRTEQALAPTDGHGAALDAVWNWLTALPEAVRLIAVGHRIVHGGAAGSAPVAIDATVLRDLTALVPLAPLHQPQALAAVRRVAAAHPELLQVACFDTAFHRTMPWQEQRLALPQALHDAGVQRFGFHGLSYESIAGSLQRELGAQAQGRIVVAHLGQGSSLCALHGLASQATTMGFTPLDGIPMATRSGALDAAVPLHLLECGQDVAQIRRLLHEQSGLLGVSGISGDMRTLLASDRESARRAVDYFCHHVVKAIASMAGALGGVDVIVLTGGIGQNAAAVRAGILGRLGWLGVQLDAAANAAPLPQSGAACITRSGCPVQAWAMATDEEAVIAQHTLRVHGEHSGTSPQRGS